MKKPYIGITGFMTHEEVSAILNSIPTPKNYLIMIGVLASWKTMHNITNKWPSRYPRKEDISKIFPNAPETLNLIHYNTSRPESIYGQLSEAERIGGKNLQGFQLNIAWPPIEELAKFRDKFSSMKIVLQIGSHALEMINHDPQQLAEKVKPYEKLVDYLLLDSSGGTGKSFDANQYLKYLSALKQGGTNIGLGIAGGLGPETIDQIESLALEFPDISIDAEGKLRNEKDDLSLSRTADYLKKSLQLLD